MKQYSVSVRVTGDEFEEPVLEAFDAFAKFELATVSATSKNKARSAMLVKIFTLVFVG